MLSRSSFFDTYSHGRSVKPLWTIDFEEDNEFLEWFRTAYSAIEEGQRARTERDLQNRDFYLGLQSLAQGRDGVPRDRDNKPLDRFARVTINQCYELVEQWVSKMTRFAPAITVIPPNQEYNDRIAATLSKEFIDYLFYVNDFDEILEEVARTVRLDGETFLFIRWNAAKGDIAPGYAKANDMGFRIPLTNSFGDQVTTKTGDPLFIEKATRVGDVEFEIVQRRFVLVQPKAKWREVEWVIEVDSCDVDELRAQYPDLAEDIGKETGGLVGSLYQPDFQWNETLVFNLYHRSSEFLDEGRFIRFTENVVLERKTIREKFGHDELPLVRLTNMDVPGILHGFSFLEQIKLLQVMYNNLASIAYTNIAKGAHLYWLIPNESNIDISKIKNSDSILKYNGRPPQLAQYRTVGPEIFQMMSYVDEKISRLAAIQNISRGEIPPGVEAGVAMTFLEEQENQRANTDIKKHNAFIKKAARLALATAGSFYDPEDGRTIRIVGKNNTFSIKALDVAKLGGPYDIRVARTTALSESKSGRLSQILALEGRFPGKMPFEQVADMLDLANEPKYYDLAAVAVRAADRENEMMAEGIRASEAKPYEDSEVHWYAHLKYMQASSYKEDLPQDRKALFDSHMLGTEVILALQFRTNPAYMQMFRMKYPQYPVFLDPGAFMQLVTGTPAPVEGQPPMEGGAPGEMPEPPVDERDTADPTETPDDVPQDEPEGVPPTDPEGAS